MGRSKTCPACGHRFIPWRIWRVTRWSHIACPACHAQLNRRFDLQLVGINILAAVMPFGALLVPGPGWIKAVSLLALLLAGWYLDATTVNLKIADGKTDHASKV